MTKKENAGLKKAKQTMECLLYLGIKFTVIPYHNSLSIEAYDENENLFDEWTFKIKEDDL